MSDELAPHVERSIDALARMHSEHEDAATKRMLAITNLTNRLGQPSALIVMALLIGAGLVFGLLKGQGSPAAPELGWLELLATLAALVVAMLILVTQRHEDALAQRRSQLTLQLAMIADERNAKIVSLIEELRRDAPGVADRNDAETDAMSKPADAARVMQEIDRRTPGD